MEIPGVKAKVDRTFQAITGRTGPNPKCPFCLHDEWARTGLGRVVHIATVREEDPTAETLFTTSLDFIYSHHRINHTARVYVRGNIHTQTIEGFFGLFKNAIRGVHHGVSPKWLQGYCNEYAWRWNRRHEPQRIFRDLLAAAAR